MAKANGYGNGDQQGLISPSTVYSQSSNAARWETRNGSVVSDFVRIIIANIILLMVGIA